MVRKSRKMSQSQEYFTPDHSHLEAKNLELAKALTETKQLYKQAISERDYLQKELVMASLRIIKLENYMNSIDIAARDTIASVLTLSDHASNILRYTNSSKRISNLDHSIHLDTSPYKHEKKSEESKMQVVKPMISGHVILRPTINLRRVNEISPEEIESLRSGQNNSQRNSGENAGQNNSPNVSESSFQRLSNVNRLRRLSDRQYMEESEDSDDNEEVNDQPINSSDGSPEMNNRLDVIDEERNSDLESTLQASPRRSSMSNARHGEATITLPSTSAQVPLLSGVFKDVRVYLSPVDPHSNITKVRGSSKAHFKRSSEIPPTRLSGSFSNNANSRESDDEDDTLQISDALRITGCTSTPHQSTNIYSDSPSQNLSNNFEVDNAAINRNIDKGKRRSENSKSRTEYLRHTQNHIYKRNSRLTNGNALLNDDYDPLEGPSNLLDSSESSKLETLYGLGLTPVAQLSQSPKPSSPALTVLKRRVSKLKQIHDQTEDENSTPRARSKLFVTNRKSGKTLQAKKSGTKKSLMRLRSPSEGKISTPTVSPKSVKIVKRKTRRRLQETNSPRSTSSIFSTTPTRSPNPRNSPLKRIRAKRSASKVSLKEPSLRKKLRRSK